MGLPVGLAHQLQQLDIPYLITLHDYWWVCANAQLVTNYSHNLCNGPQAYLNCARCALARANRSGLWPALPGIAGMLAWRNYRLRQVMLAARSLIAPTEFVRDWYATHGAPAEKVQVIPHGLPVPNLKPRQPRKSGAPVRFAYIGGLSWQKGVHILLEAFSRLDMEQAPELLIAGDDTTDPLYTAQLQALASSNVQFLGKLTRTEVWDLLGKVDVLVVPSLWYETFAFVVSEAMAAGVPVVASRLGPLADRVRHEVDGLLVPPGNVAALTAALSRFQQDSSLLPRLQAGLQPIRTIEQYLDELEGLYHKILA
jgi:glycosyltransferase involved in cell wall biosynthesis